jgi:CheY-like chemotaxis protein
MGQMSNFLNSEPNQPKKKPFQRTDFSDSATTGDQGPQALGANSDELLDFEVVNTDQPVDHDQAESTTTQAVIVPKKEPRMERRKRRRAIISAPVRVRSVDVTDSGPDEILNTTNVSRTGILFHTLNRTYSSGMHMAVTFPYSNAGGEIQAERLGRVARISELADGHQAIAIEFCEKDESLVDASGRNIALEEAPSATELAELYPEVDAKSPLVLAVDADKAMRETLKTYLTGEGYQVVAVATNAEAREVLKLMTPALVIAEIEGENLPGYDLCVHIKSTAHLKHIHVMLTTSSAFPSDYSNAHSLGAVVCIAKPFRQERFGHVVRMLAPPPEGKEKARPVRPADPTRRHVLPNNLRLSSVKNVQGNRFQFHRGK